MSVIEKLSVVSDTMTKLMNFTVSDEDVKPDFEEYLKTTGAKNNPGADISGMIIPYMFERRLPGSKKSIIEIYKDKNKELTESEIEVVDSLSMSFSSIFEIRRLFASGFELDNLIDENLYRVISLSKMNNFRGVTPGQFAVCRIFPFRGEYYLIEISNIIPSYNKESVYKYAIAGIIERPESAYEHNPKKRAAVENSIKEFGKKFEECFSSDEIITTNACADNIINMFNTYCDENILPEKEEIEKNIKNVDKNRYFAVDDFKNSYSDFMEKSLEGFSSHDTSYDIGIVYDMKSGLFVLPFYQTFCKIYEVDDYTSVQGYKDCVKSFMENDKIPAAVIRRIARKYKNFTERTNEILGTSYEFDELLNYYKPDSVNKEIYSSASVLYASKIFEKMMIAINEKENAKSKEGIDFSGVGRNDKCPCGSGKKYKNCCMPR